MISIENWVGEIGSTSTNGFCHSLRWKRSGREIEHLKERSKNFLIASLIEGETYSPIDHSDIDATF
jgi:hypothetical protein